MLLLLLFMLGQARLTRTLGQVIQQALPAQGG